MEDVVINRKVYLGDGVYARFDGYQVHMTVEDGLRITNEVWLDPDTIRALQRYFEELT